jgi:fibronectin type 3 domain-containing protein
MKKYTILALITCLVCLVGCPTHYTPDSPVDVEGTTKDTPPKETTGTLVKFVNTNDFAVTLYADHSRVVKLANVAANASTGNMAAGASGDRVFYPVYHIVLEKTEFPYSGNGIVARVDANTTTNIPVPSLYELDQTALSAPLITGVCIKIQNSSSTTLTLQRGSYEEIPQGASSALINNGETAVYTVNAGPASIYSVLKNAVTPVSFPAGLMEFCAGRIYSLKFDGTSLALLVDKPVTITQVLQTDPPSNLMAKNRTDGYITLAWDKVSTENAYGIYRSESLSGSYFQIGTADTTSYIDTAVTLGATYYYRLSSIKNTVESNMSAVIASITVQQITVSPPADLTIDGRTSGSISLSWTPVSEALNYKIYKGSGPENVTEYVATVSLPSYMVSGLMPSTTHYFAVSTVSDAGESIPSVPKLATTLGNDMGVTIAVPVTDACVLRPITGNGDGDVNPGESFYYDITVTNFGTAGVYNLQGTLAATGSAGNITVNPATLNIGYMNPGESKTVTYSVSVSSACPPGTVIPVRLTFSSGGQFWWDTPPAVTVKINTPGGLRASSVTTSSITLNWDPVPNSAGHKVYYAASESGPYTLLSSAASGSAAYVHTGRSSNTSYYYKVSALDGFGEESGLSAPISVTTERIIPPAGIQAQARSASSVLVAWDPSSYAEGYKVYSATSPSGSYNLVESTGSGVTSFTHSDLSPGTVYYYKISTLNDTNEEGEKSDAVPAKTWTPLPVFNKSISGTVSPGLPEYYRFSVSSGVSYTVTSDKAGTVIWEDGTTWFSFGSGIQTQAPTQTGWAAIRLEGAGAYTLTVKSGEAAVSGFAFNSTSPASAGTINEADKTIAVSVPYGTTLTALTPTVTPASGWTCATTGAKDFSVPVEYRFTKGDVTQVYAVTVTLKGQGGITIEPPGGDISIAGFPTTAFSVSKTGSPATHTIQISDTSYSSYEWYVDDTQKTADSGSGGRTLTIRAADYTIGSHTVTLIVWKDGVPWSNERSFTVTN